MQTSYSSDEINRLLNVFHWEEMAEFFGCSYRHLTRTIRILKDKGIIEKKRIKILDFFRVNDLSRDLYV